MRRKYDRQGLLAIDPKAFLTLFDEPEEPSVKVVDGVAIIDICGPIDQHSNWWCDSYDAIVERIDDACKGEAKTILLNIDSPGGVVAGCFEAAEAIQKKCKKAGKELVAYVSGHACSAAYALACSASKIYCPATGIVGSIGVIDTRVDLTGADSQMGIKVAFITSGKRKADGNPHLAISAAELAERQTIVDAMATVFFDWVSANRSLSVETIVGLEARIFAGVGAMAERLIDDVKSYDELLAILAGSDTGVNMDIAVMRAALVESAKGTGAAAKQAQRMLAAMDAEDKKKDEGEDAESAESEDEDEEAEGDDAPGDDEDEEEAEGEEDEEEASAPASAAVSASTTVQLAAKVNSQGKQLAKLKATAEKQERDALLAARPDVSAELRAFLQVKPVAECKVILAGIPKPKKAKPAATANLGAQATRGHSQDNGGSRLPEAQKKLLDERMGLSVATESGIQNDSHKLVLGAVAPVARKTA